MIQHADKGQEVTVIKEYWAFKLWELGTTKEAMEEIVITWLVRLWDMRTNGINLTTVEAEKTEQYSYPNLFKVKAA